MIEDPKGKRRYFVEYETGKRNGARRKENSTSTFAKLDRYGTFYQPRMAISSREARRTGYTRAFKTAGQSKVLFRHASDPGAIDQRRDQGAPLQRQVQDGRPRSELAKHAGSFGRALYGADHAGSC